MTLASGGALARRPVAEPGFRRPLARIGSGAATVAGAVSLTGIVGLSLLVVLATAERHSFLSPTSRHGFPGWMSGPLGGLLPGLTHTYLTLELELSVVVAAMFGFYVVVLATHRALPAWSIVAAVVAVDVIFFLSPPFALTDIFNYINYARMGALHGLNPYDHLPILVHQDPAYRYTTWHHLRSPYGPLFTVGTYGLAPLGVAGAYWAFKAAVMLAALGCAALVWKCAQRLGRPPAAAVAFVALNPLFLVFGLGGQHNDVFMMLLALTGVYLMLRSHEAPAGAAFVAAAAVKASAGVLLPVVLLGAHRRARALAGAAAGAVALGVMTLIAFGGHLPADAAQAKLVVPFGPTNDLGMALGLGGVTPGMRTVLQLVLAAAIVAAAAYAWWGRGRDVDGAGTPAWLIAAAGVTLALTLTLTWVMPWYVFWVLPFAALVHGRTLRAGALVMTLFLLVTWLPYGQRFNHEVLHLRPTRTATGKQNHAYLEHLLR